MESAPPDELPREVDGGGGGGSGVAAAATDDVPGNLGGHPPGATHAVLLPALDPKMDASCVAPGSVSYTHLTLPTIYSV